MPRCLGTSERCRWRRSRARYFRTVPGVHAVACDGAVDLRRRRRPVDVGRRDVKLIALQFFSFLGEKVRNILFLCFSSVDLQGHVPLVDDGGGFNAIFKGQRHDKISFFSMILYRTHCLNFFFYSLRPP